MASKRYQGGLQTALRSRRWQAAWLLAVKCTRLHMTPRQLLRYAVNTQNWNLTETIVELVNISNSMVGLVALAAVAEGQWPLIHKLLERYRQFDQSSLVSSCPADKQAQSFEQLKELIRSDIIEYMPVLGIALLLFACGEAKAVNTQDAVDFLCEAIRNNLTVGWWTQAIADGLYSHYLCLDKDHQHQILALLKHAHFTSERAPCGMLAVTLAIASRSFHDIPEILTRGIIPLEQAVPYILEIALKHEKWIGVGALFQHLVTLPDLSWSWRESGVGIHLRTYFEIGQHIQMDTDSALQPLLAVCKTNGFNEASVLLQFWCGEKEQVLDFLLQNNTPSLVRCVLQACINMNGWDIMLQILDRQEEFNGIEDHLDNILWYASKSETYCSGNAQKEIVRRLIEAGTCTNADILEGILPVINTPELLKRILEQDNIDLARVDMAGGQPYIARLACRYAQSKAREVLWQEGHMHMEEAEVYGDIQKWQKMLEMAVSAGLSTQCRASVHPFWNKNSSFDFMHSPTTFGNVDVLELFYNIGTASYHEIYKLKLRLEQETASALISKERAREVRECVENMARAPRSLQDLCRLELSFLMGCRRDRRQRVECLGLTRLLTGYILFHDVLQ